MRPLLVKACIASLAHMEERYPSPGLHLGSAKKERTAQMNGLLRKEGLGQTIERSNYNAFSAAFPLVMSFIAKGLGFLEGCDSARMNVFYTETDITMLSDHSSDARVSGKLPILWSEKWTFKSFSDTRMARSCLSGLFTLKFDHRNNLKKELERFESFSLTKAAPSKHFKVHLKQNGRTWSRRYSTRMHKTVKSL